MSTDPRLVAIGDALERAVAADPKPSGALATGPGLAAATDTDGRRGFVDAGVHGDAPRS